MSLCRISPTETTRPAPDNSDTMGIDNHKEEKILLPLRDGKGTESGSGDTGSEICFGDESRDFPPFVFCEASCGLISLSKPGIARR
jgi:hypothetical protein